MGLLNPSTVSAREISAVDRNAVSLNSRFCITSESRVITRFEIDPARERLADIQTLMEQGQKALEDDRISQSVLSFQKVLQITQNFKGRSHWEAKALFRLGDAMFAIGSFQKALEYYQSALPLMARFDKYDWNRSQQVAILHGIGKTYRALGRSRQSLNTHLQALDIAEQSTSSGNCLRKAIAYKYIGEIYADTGNLEQALVYFRGALKYRSIYSHPIDLEPVALLNNSGKIHFDLGDANQALAFFEESFQTAARLNRSANITFNRIKADSKNPHSSDQYMLKGVRSELKLGIKQLDETIAILQQLQPKLEKNPEMQSRYMTKLRDCQKLKAEMTIALNNLNKSFPIEVP